MHSKGMCQSPRLGKWMTIPRKIVFMCLSSHGYIPMFDAKHSNVDAFTMHHVVTADAAPEHRMVLFQGHQHITLWDLLCQTNFAPNVSKARVLPIYWYERNDQKTTGSFSSTDSRPHKTHLKQPKTGQCGVCWLPSKPQKSLGGLKFSNLTGATSPLLLPSSNSKSLRICPSSTAGGGVACNFCTKRVRVGSCWFNQDETNRIQCFYYVETTGVGDIFLLQSASTCSLMDVNVGVKTEHDIMPESSTTKPWLLMVWTPREFGNQLPSGHQAWLAVPWFSHEPTTISLEDCHQKKPIWTSIYLWFLPLNPPFTSMISPCPIATPQRGMLRDMLVISSATVSSPVWSLRLPAFPLDALRRRSNCGRLGLGGFGLLLRLWRRCHQ